MVSRSVLRGVLLGSGGGGSHDVQVVRHDARTDVWKPKRATRTRAWLELGRPLILITFIVLLEL